MVATENTADTQSNQQEDLFVICETDPNTITFSRDLIINLYNFNHGKYSNLSVPYSTIKFAKHAREQGYRQVTYEVFSRPDKSSHLRAMLDLWGFRSYSNYLYTVCELGFLEGLLPVVDFGFLSPDEIKFLHDVVALFKLQFFSDYDYVMNKFDVRELNRSLEIRLKSMEWVNKLGYANSAGFFAYSGQDKSQIKEWLSIIADLYNQYGVIHEVAISSLPRTVDFDKSLVSVDELKKLYALAKEILPSELPVVFPNAPVDFFKYLIEDGVTDLSTIYNSVSTDEVENIDKVISFAESKQKTLLQRFPIRKDFIQSEKYSKKLGQVFDTYRYRIKKQLQEKQKEAKQ